MERVQALGILRPDLVVELVQEVPALRVEQPVQRPEEEDVSKHQQCKERPT
jgi:hypothetical protein